MKQLTVTALEAVIDASGQGVLVVDVSGDGRPVVFVNDELARLTGMPKSGFRSNGLDEFAGIFADTDIVADCERCLGNNSSIDMMISGEQVWPCFIDGGIVKIRHYCETDALNTYLVYLQFEMIRGRIDGAQLAKEHALLEKELADSGHPHLHEFLSAWKANGMHP